MWFQYPWAGRRYGAVLAAVVLVAVCGGCGSSLSAQSDLLDKNGKAFPVAPAAGTGALAPPVRDALRASCRRCGSSAFPLMRYARSARRATVACFGTCTT